MISGKSYAALETPGPGKRWKRLCTEGDRVIELHKAASYGTRSAAGALGRELRGGEAIGNTQNEKTTYRASWKRYIGQLILGQGRYRWPALPAPSVGTEVSYVGLSLNRVMLHFPWPGVAERRVFCAGIACAAVDVDGPLVEPMGECYSHCLQLRSRSDCISAYAALPPAIV